MRSKEDILVGAYGDPAHLVTGLSRRLQRIIHPRWCSVSSLVTKQSVDRSPSASGVAMNRVLSMSMESFALDKCWVRIKIFG